MKDFVNLIKGVFSKGEKEKTYFFIEDEKNNLSKSI